jgi:hypothetical protein
MAFEERELLKVRDIELSLVLNAFLTISGTFVAIVSLKHV